MTQPGNDGALVATATSPSRKGGHNVSGDPSSYDNPESKLNDVALHLIHSLQGDFGAEGKTTCRDCLRTKSLPCSRVVEVANGELFSEKEDATDLRDSISPSQILEKAYEILLDKYTSFLPPKDDNAEASNSPSSSLECMNRISVVLRFIQLVLLLCKQQQEQQRNALSYPSEGEVNNMMVSLLKGWTHGVGELTKFCARSEQTEMDEEERNNDKNCLTADATQNLQAGPVFCYAFYSLLRMNEYVQTRGALMVPLWKGLAELAKLLLVEALTSSSASEELEHNGKHDQDHHDEVNKWRDQLPPNILTDAIRVLGDFLQEGKGRMEFEALEHCRKEGEKQEHTKRIAFQGKFVGFMVTRMSQLLKIYFSVCCETSRSKGGKMDPIPNGVWRSLLGLRGMAATLQLLCSVGLLERQTNIDGNFLKVYCEIAAKAGKCVTDTILQHRQILVPALESLLLCNMIEEGDDNEDYHNHQDCQEEEVRSKLVRISLLARTMGKVSVLQQFLENVTSEGTSAQNAEALLATVEHLHSISVPQCLSACLIAVRCTKTRSVDSMSTTPTTIVLGSLKIMARTLRAIELSPEFMASPKRDTFHRLLLRWIAGNTGDSENTNTINGGSQGHPLSRELVLSLLHAHIVGCSESGSGGSTKLLSFMAKLLFDTRTNTLLRRNIGALFVRLQSSPVTGGNSAVYAKVAKLIDREFIAWLNRNKSNRKKRTRNQSRNHLSSGLNQQDVMEISRVLGARRGVSESYFSISMPDEYQRVLGREFTRLTHHAENESLLDFAERNTLLLAWLEGCIVTGAATCFPTIRQISDLDLLEDIVRPVVTAVSCIRFKLGPTKGESESGIDLTKRKVLLYSVSMRLSAAWADAFSENSTLPIEKVCALIKNSTFKDPLRHPNIEAPFLYLVEEQESILKFEAMNLLGHISKAIPTNCSERALKTIRRSFVSFLSATNWAVSSSGISSLILFASDLNASHQEILPLCLPKASMGRFQARASSKVNNTEETIFEIVDQMTQQLSLAKPAPIKNILHTAAITEIAPGSYILEMPTKEDRTATVVFPPGPKSLEDIHYMLGGMGDEAQIKTQTLKRAFVTPRGVFKLFLAPS